MTSKTIDPKQSVSSLAPHKDGKGLEENNFALTAMFMRRDPSQQCAAPALQPSSTITLGRDVECDLPESDLEFMPTNAYQFSLASNMAYSIPGSAIAHCVEAPPPGWTRYSVTIFVDAPPTDEFNKGMQQEFRAALARL